MNIVDPHPADLRSIFLAALVGLLTTLPGLAQPRLEIHRPSETTFEFRWPGAASSFALEAANPLATPTDWQTLFESPVLVNGMYSVTLPAAVDSRFYRLRSTATGIESISPANREIGVDVTRAVVVRFNGPMDLDSVQNGGGIYAEQDGIRLLGSVELSEEDSRTVTLAFPTNLPPAARVRVTLNGSLLRDENGQLVDVRGNGLPGGVRVVEFETVDNRPPDADGDGLDDPAEATLGTDPARWDTDEDGFSDGQEREARTDPVSLDSRPGIRLPEAPGTIGDLMATFPTYGPFAVGGQAMATNGQILSRLEASLNPLATPASVNEALDSAGLRIEMLRPSLLLVSLALPARPGVAYTPAEIRSLAQQLVANSSDEAPFLYADPAFAPRSKLHPGAPGSQATYDLNAHDQIRLPAAWNLLAKPPPAPTVPVRVLVPDHYYWTTRHPQIWVQRFVPSLGWTSPVITTNGNSGNHGFAVASAIAADFDDLQPTGGYPTANQQPTDYLEILSLPIDGLGMGAFMVVVMDAIKLHQPDIVSQSQGFPGEDYPPDMRIKAAYLWQQLVRVSGRQFLHVSAAGNENDEAVPAYEKLADFDSPQNLAARRGSLDQMLLGVPEVTPNEESELRRWLALAGNPAGTFVPLENVVVVGSIDPNGSRSASSDPGEDVLVQGSDLTLACAPAYAGDNCILSGQSGTSFAAPQVAGVAAYLLTQKPDLSPTQLRDALLNTRAGDVLDAYRAVLELDAGDNTQPLRRRLLDVAGGVDTDGTGAQPDGNFDEKDLEAFISAFRDAEAGALLDPARDRSRFDLNGDGYTGGSRKASFDLNGPSGAIGSSALGPLLRTIRNVPITFDETALTDLEILCYYAYSELYVGSASERGRILGAGCCQAPLLAFIASGRYPPDPDIWYSLHVVNAETGGGGPVVEGKGRLGVPAWRPDGGELAFWAANGIQSDIFGLTVGNAAAETTTTYGLVTGPADDFMPVYLAREIPGGDKLFFVRQIAGGSVPFVVGSGQPRLLVNYGTSQGPRYPAAAISQQESVSPDNEWAFVYSEGVSPVSSIRTIKPNGVERILTSGNLGLTFGVAWSPDGRSLAFGFNGGLQLVSNTTLEVRTLDTNNVSSIRFSWSPDGRYIAYQRGNSATGMRELYAFDLMGGPLLNFGPGDGPAWSPDGKEIAFSRDYDVWVRKIATGEERRLTFTPDFVEEGIVWRPGSNAAP